MTTYGFTLQLDVAPADNDWFDRFSEAIFPHASDCTPHRRAGVTYVGFDRDAPDLRTAVLSGIESVHRADPSMTVVGVALDDGQPLDMLLGVIAT